MTGNSRRHFDDNSRVSTHRLSLQEKNIFLLKYILLLLAKAQRLRQFIKNDIVPVDGEVKNICTYCDFVIPEDDLKLVAEFNIDCTRGLLDSTDTLKHKVIYIYSWFSNS